MFTVNGQKDTSKIIFVDPAFQSGPKNTPGIAFLRGYLHGRGIETENICCERIINDNIRGQYMEELGYVLRFEGMDPRSLPSEPVLHEILYRQGPAFVWKALKEVAKNKTLTSFFSKCVSEREGGVYCFSITFRSQLFFSLLFIRYIRLNSSPGARIYLGGNYITRHARDIALLLKKEPGMVDGFVEGEGESALVALIRGEKKVPNFWERRNSSYKPPTHWHAEDINSLPGPWYEAEDTIFLQSTRACYYGKCSFCIYDIFSSTGSVRAVRKAELVVRDLQGNLKRLSREQNFSFFTDPCLPLPFLEKFSDLLADLPENKSLFRSYLRCETGMTFEHLKKAEKAGFMVFQLGPETFVPRLLKVLRKGHTRESALNIIQWCQELGIRIYLNCMTYLPTQNKQEIIEDLKTFKWIAEKYPVVEKVIITCFQLRPESYIYDHLEEFSLSIKKKAPGFLVNKVAYSQTHNNAVPYEQAYKMIMEFNEKYLSDSQKFSFHLPRPD